MAYDDAVQELYQAPPAQFVAERKRLAGQLRAAGDREGAERLLKRARPPISAWVVNQLYWHARDAFDAMLATAGRLRRGELAATADHRDAIATLRSRAAAMLVDAGHAATEAALRRVATTLAALAATGGFEPDPPGALSADRDPPGFEAAGAAIAPPAPLLPRAEPEPRNAAVDHEQTRRRAEQERARRAAERERLAAALRTARGDVLAREREVDRLARELHAAERAVASAREIVADLEAKLGGEDGPG